MIECYFTEEEFELLKSVFGAFREILLNGLKAPIKKSKKLPAIKLKNDIDTLLLKLEVIQKGGVNNG